VGAGLGADAYRRRQARPADAAAGSRGKLKANEKPGMDAGALELGELGAVAALMLGAPTQ